MRKLTEPKETKKVETVGVDNYSRNKFKIQSGNVNGKQLRSLGHVQECHGEDCPAFSICSYNTNRENCKCAVMDTSLKSIYKQFTDTLDGIGDSLNQLQLDRVGLHLMPLYQQLIKFSIEIIGHKSSVYIDKTGKELMHPQYKEIREVQACISKEIKEIGLNEIWKNKFGDSKSMMGANGQDIEEILMKGKKGAYERLLRED
jgi:hypothetical protein